MSQARPVIHVLTRDELKRERIRGVFAIGAIAILYYLRQIQPKQGPIVIAQTPQAWLDLKIPMIVVHSDLLMYLWGAYVILVAVALADDLIYADRVYSRYFAVVLTAAYAFAQFAYVIAIGFLLLAAIFLFYPLFAVFFLLYVAQLALRRETRERLRNAWSSAKLRLASEPAPSERDVQGHGQG